jgi:tyrosyl-tRNA synthetase
MRRPDKVREMAYGKKERAVVFPPIDEQLKRIERGTVTIFPREELIQKLERSRRENTPLRVKLGIDPTSPDIHIGHGVALRKLKHFQDLGHQVVLIIGDYTAMVGDPTGQDKTRPQLTHEKVLANAKTYLDQTAKILDMSRVETVFNGDWFSKMSFTDVVKLAAQMTVARMLERDDFAKRVKEGSPISLHEFLYPLMQGYDSVVIRSDVEIGATEQTFNLTVGRDLQRDAGMPPQVALTLPILVGLDGVRKMSKSLGNYIGVSETPEQQYGKAMSIPDAVIRSYFELATDVPMDEVDALIAQKGAMAAKLRLAGEIVRIYHSQEAAQRAAEHFDRTVRKKEAPDEIPEVHVPADMLKEGKLWIVKLIRHCNFAPTNNHARQLAGQGGVTLDGAVVKDGDVAIRDGMILRAGKRNYAKIRIE